MSEPIRALAGAEQVEQLADRLSEAADALHARVMRALRQQAARPLRPERGLLISHGEAQTLFDDEVALRQHANRLYMDAASHAIAGLDASQQSVLELAEAARQAIGKIDTLRDLVDIGIKLLALAGAAASGKPERVADALGKLAEQLRAVSRHKAAAAAAK